MGNWKLTRSQEPQALTDPVLREMRKGKTGGLTRRQLIRRSIGAVVALWLLEVTAGSIGFLWPNLARGFGGQINLGDMDRLNDSMELQGTSLQDGAPGYYPTARTFIVLVDRMGDPITATSKEPYSPRMTCGSCHDVTKIANAYHFQQGRTDLAGNIVVKKDYFGDGREWLLSAGMYGKW